VPGSSSAKSSSVSAGTPAAPACQIVRNSPGYPARGTVVSSTPCPLVASSSTTSSSTVRRRGSTRTSYASSHGLVVATPSWNRPSPRTAVPRYAPSGDVGARSAWWSRGGRPSGDTIASSSIAASATVRAIGPPTERPPRLARPDCEGTRPRDGLRPTRPVAAAGMRIDPPPSLPGATGRRPAATAAAAPPLEPPAPSPVDQGLRVTGPASGSV